MTNVTSAGGSLSSLSNFLGEASSLMKFIPNDVLGAAISSTGLDKYLGPLSDVMGFIEDTSDGFNTSNFLKFAVDIANHVGINVPSTDGFDWLETALNGGTLTMNDVLNVATTSGFLPSDLTQKATAFENLISSVQSTENLSDYTPTQLLSGLRSNLVSLTDNELIDKLSSENFAESWELLLQGDTQVGTLISSVVNNGETNLESLLNVAAQLNRGDHSTGSASNTNQGDTRTQEQIDYSPAQGESNIKINYPTTT